MKVLVCGDFVPINRGVAQVTNGHVFDNDIQMIIKGHELRVVNLEAPVTKPLERNRIIKDGPHLCTSEESIKFLADSGFNCVTLANNHFWDYGNCGVNDTLTAISKNMIGGGGKVGGGNSEYDQHQPMEIADEHIRIFNYCESESSVNHICGSNKLDPLSAYYELNEAKKSGYFVVVITHGGHEGYQLPSPRMKSLYRFLIDSGANVVINHHQHCYSGYESYNSGLIFYGLGNFYFDSIFKKGYIPNGWNEGYMVSLDINNRKLSNYKIIPYIQCKGNESFVRLMNDSEKKVFHDKVKELNIAIQDDKALNEAFNHFAESKYSDVMRNLSPYSNKWMLRFYNRGLLPFNISKQKAAVILNMIRCESLRDVCINILSNKLQYE